MDYGEIERLKEDGIRSMTGEKRLLAHIISGRAITLSSTYASVFIAFQSLSNRIKGGTNWLVNKIKGKMQKPLTELLKEYDLPIGIFPRDVTHYEFDEKTRMLVVYIPRVCEVCYKGSSILRFFTCVTSYLKKGKLTDIEGMKTEGLIFWFKVTSITSKGLNLRFTTAGMNKTRSREAYEVSRYGVSVGEF